MKREFLKTGDGSLTIHLPEWNEQYHSKHGAIAESSHVFISAGLDHVLQQRKLKKVAILEIGFGTGLNAYLTLLYHRNKEFAVDYTGIEAYPISKEETEKLNYSELLKEPRKAFLSLHNTDWESPCNIEDGFTLTKKKMAIEDISVREKYDLVYFDAFGPRVQPELWTESIFGAMYHALNFEGVLVTYSAKGSVRRAMLASGFEVERLPGPPGKREMLRATKTDKS